MGLVAWHSELRSGIGHNCGLDPFLAQEFCMPQVAKKRKEIVKSILVDLVYVSVAKMNKVYFVLEDSCVLTIPENYWI